VGGGVGVDAENAGGRNRRGWLLATCPEASVRDGTRAVEQARKACDLTGWKDGGYLDTLAAASAESGDFTEAVRWAKQAVEVGEDDKEELGNMRQRLSLFQAGRPYREK